MTTKYERFVMKEIPALWTETTHIIERLEVLEKTTKELKEKLEKRTDIMAEFVERLEGAL